MALWMVAFIAGHLSVLTLSNPPGLRVGAVVLALAICALAHRRGRPVGFFLAGAVWASAMVSGAAAPYAEGAEPELVLRIVDLPQRIGRSVYAIGEPIDQGAAAGRIALAWHDAPVALHSGDLWRLSLAIEPMRQTVNPGESDFSRWLYSRGVGTRATVRDGQGPLPGSRAAPLPATRTAVADFIASALPHHAHRGILQALAIGDRGALSTADRDLLRDTGTAHLMAISGLHLGLVAGWAALLIAVTSSAVVPQTFARFPRPLCCGIGAFVAAAGYTLLAGAGLPTLRALIMVGVAILALSWRRRVRPERALLVAAVVLLLIDPAAPLGAGFWLSFLAVAVILVALRLAPAGTPWMQALRIQLCLSVLMAPAAGVLFGYWQPAAALANLIAVPWVSLTTVPLTLVAVVLMPLSPAAAASLLAAAAATVDGLWPLLEWTRGLVDPWSLIAVSLAEALLAAAGLAGAALMTGARRRLLALLLCAPMIWPDHASPPAGTAWVDVLDVGEGLAVLIRTRHRTLLYDTGPGAFWGKDAGERIVVPAVRALGRRGLDALVVSHDDFQHRGGVRSVLAALDVGARWTADPVSLPLPQAQACRAGGGWQWDGVWFRFLAPAPGDPGEGENGGCVLMVEAGGTRLLLAADIERHGQRSLIGRYGDELDADLLVAPHQGRRAEAAVGFLDAVRPQVVVFSTGRDNRYGYPRPETIDGYLRGTAIIADTARTGAQRWSLSAAGLRAIELRRRDRRALWNPPVQPDDDFLYHSARRRR